jgi:outer membrane protein assembly factor BamA
LNALVSGYEMSGFYGVGNEVEEQENHSPEYYSPHLRQYRLTTSLTVPLSSTMRMTLSGSANYMHPEGGADRYVNAVRPYGVDGLAFFGVGGTVQYDTRDEPANAQEGVLFRVSGTMYPASHGLSESFSKSQCDLRAFYGGKGLPALTLALRLLGDKAWGNVPYFEQPNLGGWSGLRGFPTGRYIGDALALGTVELRASLWRVDFLVPSTMGLAVFAETGRVFVTGETSDRWHASYGGTIWIAPWSRDNTISVIAAGSREGVEFYLDVGMGF